MKAGDIVQLKSGGPKMTVTRLGSDLVWCQWFDSRGLQFNGFPEAALLESFTVRKMGAEAPIVSPDNQELKQCGS